MHFLQYGAVTSVVLLVSRLFKLRCSYHQSHGSAVVVAKHSSAFSRALCKDVS